MKGDRPIAILVVVAITVLAVSAPTAVANERADSQSEVTLTVQVTDPLNNEIDSATVTAEWDGGSTSGETASNGMVLLDVPEGTQVELSVDHHAYVRNSPLVIEEAEGQEINLTVYRKAEGKVNVIENGEPLKNARVLFYQDGELVTQGRTDADGSFSSGTIERGEYHVIAVKEGYFENRTDVEVVDTKEVTLALEQGDVQLQVSVTDDHFTPAEPVKDAEVEIETVGTVLTRTNGKQTVVVPVNSEIEITATKDGYETTTKTVSVGEQDKTVDVTITKEDNLNITSSNQRAVSGENVRLEVTDEYGDAVEGATILVDGEESGTTNADGVARVTLDAEGTVTITAEHEGVTSEDVTVEVISEGEDPSPEATETPEEDSLPVPGFGPGAALLALAGAVLITRRLS
ncbi:hypothetical protein BRC81_04425 [Halobacteriales archaeon QS_1_68_20]|nr:MAG: hypothetical protein BRC81_04425 [Halobacteriales archaeon QS_1_68_20]